MTKKIKLIFNSSQEYIESEYMVFKTLESSMKKGDISPLNKKE